MIDDYEQEVTLIAARYAEHYEIAKGALESYQIFVTTNNTAMYRKYNKLEGKQHLIICLTFAIAAVEAFVNRLGYTFDSDWLKHEGKNFFDQLAQVTIVLEKRGIAVSKLLCQSYPDFENHRRIMRNPIQHPRSSHHDSARAKKTVTRENATEQFNKIGSSFFCLWADIKPVDARNAVNGVYKFIDCLHSEIEKMTPIIFNDESRDNLLTHFIDDPFCAIELVSGSTSLKTL